MEEQFDKQFPENSMVYDGGSKGEFVYQENQRQRLKSFLSTSIAQALTDYKKEIEEQMPKPQNIEFAEHDLKLATNPSVIELLAKQVGYNDALKEVKDILNKI